MPPILRGAANHVGLTPRGLQDAQCFWVVFGSKKGPKSGVASDWVKPTLLNQFFQNVAMGPQMWSREPQARLGPCFYTQISLVDMNLDETTKMTSNSILDRKNGINIAL